MAVNYDNDQRIEHHLWQNHIQVTYGTSDPHTAIFLPGPSRSRHEVDSYLEQIPHANTVILCENNKAVAAVLDKEVYPENNIYLDRRALHKCLSVKEENEDPFGFLSADFIGNFDTLSNGTTGTETKRVIKNFLRHSTDVSIMIFNHNLTYRCYDVYQRVRVFSEDPTFSDFFEQPAPHDVSISALIAMSTVEQSHGQYSVSLVDAFRYKSLSGKHNQLFERTAVRVDKSLPYSHESFISSIRNLHPNHLLCGRSLPYEPQTTSII